VVHLQSDKQLKDLFFLWNKIFCTTVHDVDVGLFVGESQDKI